ncbi:transglutaminase-like cysteine peptidase [Pelagibacterium xiamenense]|uniref:transglutaminase-like cysteine peptidase n=1 Tax=Pelagibacterium xiamenense TaxID=2901140 RepID=UPI001E500C34|nr:transglutaminase-like cysteine peptidase [Pelagibacterium xiamenense]MCD7059919.1 transglutaminase-like cysteine peptidase [Pelagibacterium xiamenense]
MMKTKNILVASLVAAMTLLAAAMPASADQGLLHPAFASATNVTSIPVGHAEFCARRSAECQPFANPIENVSLTEGLWAELQDVNNRFNTSVTPANDGDLYGISEFWTFPSNGYGDCEDFVLAKRAALIERGWNPSTLLITVVRQSNGEGHAVLMVRTDRGDLILDNQEALIKVWTDTPYTYLKRQSQAHAGQWVNILDNRFEDVAVTAAH